MSDKVVTFKPVEFEVDEPTVHAIKELLALAKAGKVIGVSIIGKMRNKEGLTWNHTINNTVELLGLLAIHKTILANHIVMNFHEDDVPIPDDLEDASDETPTKD